MSQFPNKAFRQTATTVALYFVIAISLNAQVPNNQPTILTGTQDFLKAFYPEFFGRKAMISMNLLGSVDRQWNILAQIEFNVMRFDPRSEAMLNPPYDAKTGKRLPPPENTLLKGDILFDGKGWLHAFEAVGDVVHTKEYDAFVELLDSHHEWSDEDAARALKKAGARFGPSEKNEFIKTIQLVKLEHFMGKLELQSVEFEPLPENHSEGNTALGSYRWVVTVDRILANGKRIPYDLRFEPFQGKLTAVHKKSELVGMLQEDED